MAYDGVEVELRLRVDGTVAGRVLDRLRAHGGTTVEHADIYFDDPARSFLRTRPVREWLSVRQRGTQVTVNHKRWHYRADGVATHNEELDLVVSDAGVATRLLESLGYRPLVAVRKTRAEAVAFPGVLVALDVVERLGAFVELEALQPFGSIEETRAHLRECAQALGLDPDRIDYSGYPMLLLDLEQRLPPGAS